VNANSTEIVKQGGISANKTRLLSKTTELLLRKLAQIKIPSAAKIKAVNETLKLLIIFVLLFKDWPTRLIMIIALISISWRRK
jgi:hypothetical protein